ncbi:MAG: Ribonuclease Y [Candidatus Shapirobacteria bacterium GW2011_GWE1_38_92]|uniref:Ribonuclease Y n=2 Tax=Candidatus Shapironibacteriota TaxID=1752721 RepID=A0A0G0K7V0_9BACT|nr:MAG: Ribonuclease Y [Candidatus Shapirobacteria bacterium GW2011_GWE2_38_30]KKQ91217.1 MAG: Ribonuclease Y [Candidatus Shapirobacteria bacterium GW2011_GWE1_38_92]HCU55442.1 ribonuclease Y [Candidatus Shapirobacteria bacterium]
MFSSIFSKVSDLLGNKTLPSQPTQTKLDDSGKNRVSFQPKPDQSPKVVKKTIKKQKTVSQEDIIASQKTQQALENASRLEAEARKKEAEIFQRLASLDEKEKYLIQKEKNLDTQSNDLKTKYAQVDELYKKQLDKLEQISGIDVEKAKQIIINSTEKKMVNWIAKKVTDAKEQIKQKEEEASKEILVDAIRHGVTDYVAEYTVSTITLPDEKIKGKIIGREGRNIRSFEKVTGVELELDETNDVRISSFDSTRREIARISLEKLIKDGRIQPVKIETIVAQTKLEMDKILLNEGKKICQEVGVFNLPIDLMKYIGKYKFRFSYGQNLAKHTIEATKIAVALAYELHADVNTVRLGALLHDIGKVISDQEGTHIDLGVDLLRQFRLPESVINAVAEHHEDKEFSSPESVIVYLGDASSGARPGARYEVHEEYLKRMTNIEEVAKSFSGVINVAAYQAGREVMVIVDPGQVSDSEAEVLSQNIAEKLEEEAKWAGQIKVTVIREMRTSSVIVGSKISKNAVKISD